MNFYKPRANSLRASCGRGRQYRDSCTRGSRENPVVLPENGLNGTVVWAEPVTNPAKTSTEMTSKVKKRKNRAGTGCQLGRGFLGLGGGGYQRTSTRAVKPSKLMNPNRLSDSSAKLFFCTALIHSLVRTMLYQVLNE